ncbi:MAG: Tex-like N-terminal domain-containing protein, partial [Thermoguttaceae bacterium]
MSSIVTIDLRHVARGLDVPLRQIQAVVELLDEGNTVPFITRYRKDRTGGLDEEQIREIQSRLAKMRLLADRKQTILRSIEAQGKLTEKLAKQIHSAMSTKRLEDLYLPYKPKKQTLATLARTRGLEELAHEILDAAESCTDLDSRARDFANTDRQVPSAAEALLGAGHILAEHFSERADLRQRLREILQRTGKIISTQIGGEPAPPVAAHGATVRPEAPPAVSGGATVEAQPAEGGDAAGGANSPAVHPHPDHLPEGEGDANANPPAVHPHPDPLPLVLQRQAGEGDMNADPPQDHRVPLALPVPPTVVAEPAAVSPPARPAPAKRIKENVKAAKLNKKELKKKRIEQRRIKAFRDYFNYCEEIKKIPPHRILAINRAERARVLRVRIECDLEAMHEALDEMLVPPGHPHADYLRGCARDALQRLILPALERDIRRELTDRAEAHAVGVFAKNLRNLLLQPPVHNRRVLAVDPGYKSGCKLAALDQFGNILAHDVIWLVGKPERRDEAKQKVIELVTRCELSVVAVGNGTASRETEDFFAELISNELQGRGVAYLVVNEAGASVYSTSQTGREEFPHYDATLRGAISIGRRLQDPLSELVKIDPANIGVGLYQHDVKAKHLRVSLDDVV